MDLSAKTRGRAGSSSGSGAWLQAALAGRCTEADAAPGRGGGHGGTQHACARPSGRRRASVRCPASCKSTSVSANPITSTKDNSTHQNKDPLNIGSQIKSGSQAKTLRGVLLQTLSLYPRVTFSVRPYPTNLFKTTTPTTKLLISFSCCFTAQNFTEFQSKKDL